MNIEVTLSGFMATVGSLIQGAIRRQILEQMRRFRAFAESA
jgi:hypothetical protein